MNIALGYEDLFGNIDTQYLSKTTTEIFELAEEIRGKLGKQSYLLDSYLCKVLSGMSKMNTLAAMERAQRSALRFNDTVYKAMDNCKTDVEHPFYETAKQYIETHPLEYQEEATRYNIYTAALLDNFLETEAEAFRKKLKDKLSGIFDKIEVRHLACSIGHIAGNMYMERLNLLLCQRFSLVTPMAAFAQGLTEELLSSLVCRDDETGKTVAQLWREAVGVE